MLPYQIPAFAGNPYQQASFQPMSGYVQVAGLEGARAYQMMPNTRMPLFDTDDDVFYDVSADAGGGKSITAYRFEQVIEPSPDDLYATKEDLAAINEKLDELIGAINAKQPVPEAPKAAARPAARGRKPAKATETSE